MLVRQIFDMKSLLTCDRIAGQIDRAAHYDRLRFTQSKFIDRSRTVQFELTQIRNRRAHETTAALMYKHLF